MCGISGLWFGSETEEELLQKYGYQMSNNLYKRGPDSGDIWNDPNLKIEWPIDKLDGMKPKLSIKDFNAATIKNAEDLGFIF